MAVAAISSANALTLNTPYLQNLTSDGVTIMYQADAPVMSRVEYWTTDSVNPMSARQLFGGQEVVHSPEHVVRLNNLTPGTTYHYRVVAREILENHAYSKKFGAEEITSPTYTFTTTPDHPEDFTILIFNDLHSCGESISRLAEMAAATPHDMVVFNGDCLSEPANRDHAIKEVQNLVNAFGLHSVPALFVRGNHEIRNAYSSGMPSLFDRFEGKTYGAITLGDTRIVVLDCGEDKPDDTWVYYGLNDFTGLRQQQVDFLKQELKSKEFRRAKHRVLIHHIPIWGNVDKYQPCTELWAPLLKNAPFDVDIAAHNHDYVEYQPVKGEHPFPVIIGGGPKPSEATMTIVKRRGKTLTTEVKLLM